MRIHADPDPDTDPDPKPWYFKNFKPMQVVKSLLKILNLAHGDNGTYLCYGQNAHSSYTAIVEALVYDVPSVR